MTLRGTPGKPYVVEPLDETAPALVEWDGGFETVENSNAAHRLVERLCDGRGFEPEDFTISANEPS